MSQLEGVSMRGGLNRDSVTPQTWPPAVPGKKEATIGTCAHTVIGSVYGGEDPADTDTDTGISVGGVLIPVQR